MPDAGDVVSINFPGAVETKRRPAVVLSTAQYHVGRPDVIVGLLTSQVAKATASTDHVLTNWRGANLSKPTAFRSYIWTAPRTAIISRIGKLDAADWREVQGCLARAMEIS